MSLKFETKHRLPFGIFSSSVDSGYNSIISSSFAPGLDIANLHNDNYGTYENSPAQGPFTETHVGGNQHRHVPLNTGSQDNTTRPEAFIINFDTPGELRVYGPDSLGNDAPRASMLRGNSAKRPLNIQNLRTTTGSSTLGNYQRDYEVVQTSGRRINNRFLTKAGDIPVIAKNSTYVTGLVEFELVDRDATGSNKFIFVERFNAPGGPDVSSRGALDIESEEMAANNALPFRNLNVKLPLRSFLTQHANQFGQSSFAEHTGSAFSDAASASYHKINRNTFCRPDSEETSSYKKIYDNYYVQHPIPQSDIQYAWVTESANTTMCQLSGYQRSGSMSNKGGAFTDVEFVGSRKRNDGTSNALLGDFLGITGSDNGIKSSSVDMNNHVWNNSILELWVNNGAYQYPTWKQLRTGEHPIARALRANNIVAVQNNSKIIVKDSVTNTRRTFQARFSDSFENFIDPPVSSRYHPIEHQLMLKGAVNPLLAHEIKHTYGNNLGMFANKELNKRLGTSKNEEQTYDKIYDFYADQDLPEEDNPVSRFLGLTYRETIHPREENSYLAVTRSRTEYTSGSLFPMVTNGATSFPESSSYSQVNGELMNDTDSSLYTDTVTSSLCFIEATSNFISGASSDYIERLTEVIANVNPWFDSYADYAEDIRRLGKDCSIIPEFSTSEHMEFYVSENNGNFRADNRKIFSLPGASITSSANIEGQADYDVNFRKKYLTSDKMKHFDDIKNEHDDIAEVSKITLRCKGIKKLLPYEGFYPQNRTVQIGNLLSQSLAPFVTGYSGSDSNDTFGVHGMQALLKPLVSPGILYNSIKGGIAVDYPIYTASAPATRETGTNDTSEFVLADPPNYRLPFESLVSLTEHLPNNSPIRFVSTFNSGSAELSFPYYFKWDGNKDALYELAMHNFLAEVPNFFLADGTLNNYSSAPEFQFKEFTADKTYYMDVVLQQNIVNNKFPTYVGTSSAKTDAASIVGDGVAEFGTYVTMNETRLAAAEGFSFTDEPVKVYNNSGSAPSWGLEAVLTASAGSTLYALAMNSEGGIVTIREDGASNDFFEYFVSSSSGWNVAQQFVGSNARPFLGGPIHFSGSYIAAGLSTEDVEVWRSGSSGFFLDATITKTGPSAGGFGRGRVRLDTFGGNNRLLIPDTPLFGTPAGDVELWTSSSSGWALEAAFSGSGIGQLGYSAASALSGAYIALGSGSFTAGSQKIQIYKSGSSGWALEESIVPLTASSNPGQLEFSIENGYLVSTSQVGGGDQKGTIQVYNSGSSGWFLESNIDNVTGSFSILLESLAFPTPGNLSVHGNKFTVGAPFQFSGAGATYTFISESCGWLPLYGDGRIGEFNLRQNGRLFGMALPVTGGTVQFNKSLNVYDPAYMAYTPPSFYGEAIARISFTPTTSGRFTLEEIFENSIVENILNQNNDRTAIFVDPTIADTGSLAYQHKMTVSASVTLFGKFSEPNVEFDLVNTNRAGSKTGFQPSKATRSENTNKERWSIGTKFEAPIYDVSKYDAQYSSSYTSHFINAVTSSFCGIEDLEFQTPRTPWTNYADALSDKEGVFFDIKESFSPDRYDNTTGSLLQNCGFTAGRKKVGRLADQKEISEAIVAIPYVERAIEGLTVQNSSDCGKHFIKIDPETFRTQKENLEKLGIAVKREETSEGKTQKSATTITKMIQNMSKFVVPPQMDFVKFEDINPFVMYMFDFSTVLNKRDLINIWHGVMPEPSIRMEKDEIVITHDMNKDEFFHGAALPDNVRWLVFKVKQRANQNYFEVTTDASDDNRFRFDFQGDGKVEVIPEMNFNWPYDYFSLVELSKIEVEVQLNNKNELEKLAQSGTNLQSPLPGTFTQTRGKKGKGKK